MTSVADALEDGRFKLRFSDVELERAFRAGYMRAGSRDILRIIRIAAFLIAVSAPFDFFVIGRGEMTKDVIVCWSIRAALVVMLMLLPSLSRRLPKNLRTPLLVGGWCTAVVSFGFVMGFASPEDMPKYLHFLPVASLIMTSFLPLVWERARLTQSIFLAPIFYCMALALRSGEPIIWADWAFPVFVLAAVIYLGLSSRYGYELAIRENFLRNRELEEARDAARRADLAKSDFLATISHELRTPLNAILGNIRLLRGTVSLDPEPEAMVKDAENAGRAMSHLVEDLLEVISLDIPDRQSTTRAFRVGDVIDDLEAILGVLGTEKGLALEWPGDEVRNAVREGDAGRLRHILLNLLGNAVKFTRDGGVGLRIRLDARRLRFFVYDTGVGMPIEDAMQAFSPFFRGSNGTSGEFRGAGLGLHIVQRYTEEAGGRVALRSQPGKGTCVRGVLPMAASYEAVVPERADPDRPKAERPLTVLVVEDEPMNMAIMRRMLTLEGHQMLEAATGSEALRIIQTARPDAIFTDIRLPDMNGVALAQSLTQSAQKDVRLDVPIYAVTANVLAEDLKRYEEAGFDGVISKPINLEKLREALCDIAFLGNSFLLSGRASAERDIVLSSELAQLYHESLTHCAQDLRTAFTTCDVDRVGATAHRLAGAAMSAGDRELAALALRIEAKARRRERIDEELLENLEVQVDHALNRAKAAE